MKQKLLQQYPSLAWRPKACPSRKTGLAEDAQAPALASLERGSATAEEQLPKMSLPERPIINYNASIMNQLQPNDRSLYLLPCSYGPLVKWGLRLAGFAAH